MKCEICEKNEAVVHFSQVYNGLVKEMSVCEKCAAQKGFDVHSHMPLTDLIFGIGAQQDGEKEDDGKTCPTCNMRLGDFRKTSRLGCPACYETFSDELMPLIESMHKGSRHVGKTPLGEGLTAESASLQKALQEAVASQNFEEAAKLRDRIRGLA